MASEKINNSINANIGIDQLKKDITEFANEVVFTSSGGSTVMKSAANVLIKNIELNHLSDNFSTVEKIFERSQDLVIRGKQAQEKLGPSPTRRAATADDVARGYASSVGNHSGNGLDLLWQVPYSAGSPIEVADKNSTLRPGSINQQLLERFLYRGELYFSLYNAPAPELEALSIQDPYQVDDPQYAEKMYTTEQKLEITSWLLDNLKNSEEDLATLVFSTAESNIALERKNTRNKLLEGKIGYYITQLLELKKVINELDHKEAYLALINNHIKELEA